MPSACTKPEKKASNEVETPGKQLLVVVDKKVRNLEKRKSKLDVIREKAAGGTTLNADQQEAVSRYENVLQNLEFARELQKQFNSIQNEVEKQMKKQAKKESHERQQTELRRVQELLTLQNLLDSLGAEDVRADFLAGRKGAVLVTEEEFDKLDELYKLISPSRDEENAYAEQVLTASEHIVNYLDAREKEVIGTTYKDLKALVEKIKGCSYFDAKATTAEEPAEETCEDETVEEVAADIAAVSQESNAAPIEQESQDYSLQAQLATESLPEAPVQSDFTGDAATMLGQPQQPTNGQMLEEEPNTDPATAAPEAETFFSTQPFPQPRPFNEIVSSVQATFTFIQDSEIEAKSAAQQQQQPMDPAVMAAAAQIAPASQPPPGDLSFLPDTHAAAAAASQFQSQELSDGQSAAANNSSAPAASAFTSDPASMYGGISQGLQNASTPQQQQAGAGFPGAESAADGGPPQPIPLPGQYSSDADQSSAAAAAAQHDRNGNRQQFAMNPNADIFQSMYKGDGAQQQQQQAPSNTYPNQQQQSAGGAAGADTRQQAWGSTSTDFQPQGYGASQYGGRRGNGQGAPAAAAGGYRNQQARNGGANNMNGYRGGNNMRSAPGNQRGGNSRGGGYNGASRNIQQPQQAGGSMRGPAGGSGGGAYKGYPSRNDYQPEGGYQGYNASNTGFMPSQQGGARGGPRNSVPRSGRGGGNYGNQRMPPQ